jgi:three-Cys-motif partner protein
MALIDPEDGLPVSEIRQWSLEKHERLRKYVDAAHGARSKFSSSAYVDLYCGPGRSRITETGVFVDGSPVVAFTSAARFKDQFTDFYIADTNPDYVSAAKARLERRGARVHALVGEARGVVDEVVASLDKSGLHFAFLDPYNLESLPFVVIEKLAALKRMDFLIHVSSMDLKRDLHNYLKPESRVLDDFAPGWREQVDQRQRLENIRQEIFDHWRGLLVSNLQTRPSERVEEVLNSKNTDLYWLVFVARADLAHRLWEDIANISPQGRLI